MINENHYELTYALNQRTKDAFVKYVDLHVKDVNEPLEKNLTLLMEVSTYEYARSKIVWLTIMKNANVNAKADQGFTALMAAAISGSSLNVEALLIAGADPFALLSAKKTAHQLAESVKNTIPLEDHELHNEYNKVLSLLKNAEAKANAKTAEEARDLNEGAALLFGLGKRSMPDQGNGSNKRPTKTLG